MMKTSNLLLLCSAGVGATILTLGNALAGISGSSHDFSARNWSSGETCKVCHTPHNAVQTLAGVQLWNRTATTATFTLYRSSTLNSTPGEPGPQSKTCLSCHDGTVAIDSFGGATGSDFVAGRALIGTDLSNDHPVGLPFYHAPGLSCANCHSGHPMRFTSVLPFFNGKVECASCHDVHNVRAAGPKLVRKTLAGSALCLHCHPK